MMLLLSGLALCAAGVLFWRAVRLTRALDRLLDQAIQGDAVPAHYDESRLSRTAGKLARFLAASALSRQRIDADRARIQSLIGDIAHQTRTPVANVVLYTALLREQALTPEQDALAQQAVAQAEKLGFLIDALVKTSRLETGMVQVRARPGSSLSALLVGLAETFAPAAQARQLTLTVQPTAETACFDPKWTAEAVGNLIDNAIKYTPAGGRVQVAVRAFPMFCAVEVSDTGPGLTESEQAQVFARFYRAPGAQDAPGVGVGLYLARQIVSAQGGYIRVRAKPGQGAVFAAFLPRGTDAP